MSVVLDYLVKNSKKQNQEIIEKISIDSVQIQMKVYGSDNVYTVRIRPSVQKDVYVIQYRGLAFENKEMLTFKIEINSRIYFFKTQGLENTKSIQLDQNSDLYELIRRKEPRYKVPTEWPQFALIINTISKNLKATAEIKEISFSGMKLMIRPELPRFEVGQTIKVQFKIYKRSQIITEAIIRHLRKNKIGGPTVGIEFNAMSLLNHGKIQNILDDISFYYTHLSNKI